MNYIFCLKIQSTLAHRVLYTNFFKLQPGSISVGIINSVYARFKTEKQVQKNSDSKKVVQSAVLFKANEDTGHSKKKKKKKKKLL